MAVCHRRFGKTLMIIHCLIECQHRNPQGSFIAPTYQQAERNAFEYLKEATKVFPGVKYNAAKLRCEIPNPQVGKITIFLLSGSSESSEQIRGMYMDALVLDEYQDLPPKVFPQIVRPALADRRGKCLWIGNPRAIMPSRQSMTRGLPK